MPRQQERRIAARFVPRRVAIDEDERAPMQLVRIKRRNPPG
jgi:hypothetical protein